MRLKPSFSSFFLIICPLLNYALAQVDTSGISITTEPILISAPRLSVALSSLPRSVTIVEVNPNGAENQSLSLNEFFQEVTGLFVLNANNYAQDLRISIRGFGARSAFGIRGVKLIVDGVPETTPDGQGQIDNIDLSVLSKLEILRGGSSSLYGNASGGVISIQTKDKVEKPYLSIGATMGSYNMHRYEIEAGLKSRRSQVILHAGHTNVDGYREQSEMVSTNLNAKWIYKLSEKGTLNVVANYTNSPTADDPGGVNLAQVEENPRTARNLNLSFDAGEAITQYKISTSYKTSVGANWTLDAYAFVNNRDFYGRLPFEDGGIVDLQRKYSGTGVNMTHKLLLDNGINLFQWGVDLSAQVDGRVRYDNLQGIQGPESFHQDEIFSNIGLYVQDQYSIGAWTFEGGLRMDLNKLQAKDMILSNGDNSDEIDLNTFNPSFGVSYKSSATSSIFFNLASSFETPTLSELSVDPSGAEGFNRDLKAMTALTKELGVRGSIFDLLNYELVLFHINSNNEIVPYEIARFPGRDFFRNAGRTERKGIELTAKYHLSPDWVIDGSYSLMNVTYKDYISGNSDFSGNEIPGIPKSRGSLSTVYQSKKDLILKVQALFTSQLFLDDSNQNISPSYQLINCYFGHPLKVGKGTFFLFAGINNLTDSDYYDNVRINAFGGRFYEAGPKRNYYGGIKFKF